MKLHFVTGNKGKIKEARAILGMPIEIESLEVDEVQSLDIKYIVQKKVAAAYATIHKPLIMDDAGLYIDAWNGFPGPLVKFISSSGGNELLLRMMRNEDNRRAIFKSTVGFHDGSEIHVFTGEVHGTITKTEKGSNGWGYDPIFIPEGYTQTFSEMSTEEKNKISHRKRALEKLKKYLKNKKLI